jgi:ADP-L-glycero-D-manno-heptose 6-epimerase
MPEVLRGKYQYFTQAEVAKMQGAAPGLPAASPLADSVADYVTNYLATGEYLGDETAAK